MSCGCLFRSELTQHGAKDGAQHVALVPCEGWCGLGCCSRSREFVRRQHRRGVIHHEFSKPDRALLSSASRVRAGAGVGRRRRAGQRSG